MKNILLTLLALILLMPVCLAQQKEELVLISTEFGTMTVRLYDKTPLHKQNFLKLAKEGYYDSLLFHRVIQNFMIQGGDPDSRYAEAGRMLGDGGPAYTIPFEYVPEYIHKKGVIAAARESDDINPKKASSASQFYIVQGKVLKDEDFATIEKKVEKRTKKYILLSMLRAQSPAKCREFENAMTSNDTATQRRIAEPMRPKVDSAYALTKPFKISEYQRNIYKTTGGVPHLDESYTVFGEVISGLEVIDKIAAVKTDKNDRPLENVRMTVSIILQ